MPRNSRCKSATVRNRTPGTQKGTVFLTSESLEPSGKRVPFSTSRRIDGEDQTSINHRNTHCTTPILSYSMKPNFSFTPIVLPETKLSNKLFIP